MQRLRIVASGYIGLIAAGGVAWDYVQYPAGLAALGHDVFYVEDTQLTPVQRKGDGQKKWGDCAGNVAYLRGVMEAFGLRKRWAYRDELAGEWFGLSAEAVREICRTADVFINVSCASHLRDEYRRIPARVLVDSDPMYTQINYLAQSMFMPGRPGSRELLEGHTHHFTFGERIGADDCRVPECGFRWRTTRQPICLSRWTARELPARSDAAFTTVMHWNAAPPLRYDGETWGQKEVEFRKIIGLPGAVAGVPLAVAVGHRPGTPFPVREATRHGWRVLDARALVHEAGAYQSFVEESRGEFSIAKETYVKARTGWFSGRSACYLAAGRPVVAQDTGWSSCLPEGCGLLAFDDLESAADALRRVVAEPGRHARAARAVAEECFDSRRVLADMLAQVGA